MNYLRNCWYMAAWADEVGDNCLARTFLEEPIVLFRDAHGAPVALRDRCSHRFAPLSRGHVSDGAVVCAYHGLAFGQGGACVFNPHGPTTHALDVRSYPIREAYSALWIWMGEPERAEEVPLRDLSFLSKAPATAFSKGYVCGGGNYQLFVDNILDLTHADFLHPSTLGGGAFTRTRAQVKQDGGMISVMWDCINETPSPLQRQRLPIEVAAVDSWTEVIWSAPAVMTLLTGIVPAGTSRANSGEALNVHIMTPQTAKTTHYFYAATRDFKLDDAAFNERIRLVRDEIFANEDDPMIRAQQDRIGNADFWSLKPSLLSIDEGAVRVRRYLDRLIAEEQATV